MGCRWWSPASGHRWQMVTACQSRASWWRRSRLWQVTPLRPRHQPPPDAVRGVPVSGARVVATGHMRFMDHGSFRQAATPSSDGQYALPLAFAMPGEWRVDLDIVTDTEKGAFNWTSISSTKITVD